MTINFRYWKTRVVRYPALIATSLLALVVTGLYFELNKAEWATWVGAIGTIGAIVGAYLGLQAQIRAAGMAAIAAEQRAKRKHQQSILAITKAALAAVDALPSRAEHTVQGKLSVSVKYDGRIFEGLIDALDAITIHELGSAEAVNAFLGIKNGMIRIQAEVEDFSELAIPTAQCMYPEGGGDPNSALKIGTKKSRIAESFASLERIFSE